MNKYIFNYNKLKLVPDIVRVLCFSYNSWIVGGAAEFMCDKVDSVKDWDIIVPISNWQKASRILPYGCKTNTFGGIKIESGQTQIDVWASDVGYYFQSAIMMGYISNPMIAVSPRTKQVCLCHIDSIQVQKNKNDIE